MEGEKGREREERKGVGEAIIVEGRERRRETYRSSMKAASAGDGDRVSRKGGGQSHDQ